MLVKSGCGQFRKAQFDLFSMFVYYVYCNMITEPLQKIDIIFNVYRPAPIMLENLPIILLT